VDSNRVTVEWTVTHLCCFGLGCRKWAHFMLGWFRPSLFVGRVWPVRKICFKELFKYVIFWKFVDALFINICLFFYMVKIHVRYENTRFSSRHQKNIKWKMFCFPAYGQYPNIVFMFFIYKKQIFEALKMCFRMDFLNTTKIIFLAFLDFTTCL